MYQLICEDSLEGIFSGIYEAWAGRYDRNQVSLAVGSPDNYQLFTEYIPVSVNCEHARSVMRTLRQRFGQEDYEYICYALWSCYPDKADVAFQTIRYGIENHMGRGLLDHQTLPFVRRLYELNRTVFNESHHLLGFVRFAQLETGGLYSQICSKNYVLEVLAEYFSDRLPMENWLIFDETRNIAVIHPAGRPWLLQDCTGLTEEGQPEYSAEEEYYQQLWCAFCKEISITDRANAFLQRQNMPLRFRSNMVEFWKTE